MRRVLEDYSTYLSSLGIGRVGTNIFIGQLPNDPDKAIAIISSGGLATSGEILRPSMQVLIRDVAGNFGTVSNLADYVFQVSDGKWNILPRFPGRMTASAPSGANYRDDRGRWVFSLNFQVETVSTTVSTPASL